MFPDDFYIDALGRQAAVTDRTVQHHAQCLIDGLDDDDAARAVALAVADYRDMLRRATPVQLIVHAAERAQAIHAR